MLILNHASPIDGSLEDGLGGAAVAAARETVERLTASIGSSAIDAHAALFAAFERLASEIDLDCPGAAPAKPRAGSRIDRPGVEYW